MTQTNGNCVQNQDNSLIETPTLIEHQTRPKNYHKTTIKKFSEKLKHWYLVIVIILTQK